MTKVLKSPGVVPDEALNRGIGWGRTTVPVRNAGVENFVNSEGEHMRNGDDRPFVADAGL